MTLKRVKGNPACTLCPLHQHARTTCVMGIGGVPAKVMIVGEAPGANEDEQGRPFVGNAGEVLNEALKKAGLNRSEVYVTNAVKCRPPQNRTPTAKEQRACAPYLAKEVRMVRPEYVLLLGSTALKAYLGTEYKISQVRGSFIEHNGQKVFPAYHPAAGLHDPSKLPVIMSDLERFFGAASGKAPVEQGRPEYVILDPLKPFPLAFLNWVEERNLTLSLDIETTGLNPWAEDAWVNQIQLGTHDYVWVWNLQGLSREALQPFCEGLQKIFDTARIVAHNGKFDLRYLRVVLGLKAKLYADTMLADHLLDENRRHGLKDLASQHFGASNYDVGLEVKKGKTDPASLALYGAYDVYYTHKLYKKYSEELGEKPQLERLFFGLVMPASQAYLRAELRGVYVDRPRMEAAKEFLAEDIGRYGEELKAVADINWASPKQVADVLFGRLGLHPIDLTPTGARSVSESVLKRLSQYHPVCNTLLAYREHVKLLSFITAWESRLDGGSRMHPTFKLSGTVTGRPSCEEPNLQQVPRDKRIRPLISAPPGWVLVEADFSQIELRVAAMFAREKNMLEVFRKGRDIHTRTAELVSGIPASQMSPQTLKEWRTKAKPVNFGFLYGMGAAKFSDYARDNYGVHFSPEEAQDFRDRFFQAYPGLVRWHERMRLEAYERGQVNNPIGRIRRLPDIYSSNSFKRSEAERQAINSPVQGFASDLTLMSVVQINRELYPFVRVVGSVHDSILMEVRRVKHFDDLLYRIREIMEHNPILSEVFGFVPSVPIVAEISVGPWGDGIPWEHPGKM